MNAAIYVEGQTEATYIRNTLTAFYGFGNVSVDTLHLAKGARTPHPVICDAAPNKFFIVIAPGDGKVLSAMKSRYEGHLAKGFDVVVGLCDMFGREYKKRATTFDREVVKQFQDVTAEVMPTEYEDKVYFKFAIMETEAWILALPSSIEELLGDRATVDNIKQCLSLDLVNDQLEEIMHPTSKLEAIFDLAGSEYKKTEDNIEGLSRGLVKEDILKLLEHPRLESYKDFFSIILV